MTERRAREWVLRSALWIALGGWFGSFALFGLVVAPVAFSVLPSTEIAGSLVAPVLTALHLYGGAAGLALALLARALGRGRLLTALPLLLGAACLASHFGVSLPMAEIHDRAFGPEGNLEAAALFNQLHRLSVSIFLGVSTGVVALLILHVRSEAASDRAPGDLRAAGAARK